MLNPLWGFCTSKQAPTQTPAPSESFNPLWDFYSSKPAKHSQKSRCTKCFNPLWGFYSSKQCMVSSLTTMLYVSIPFGVSTLPNCISAIPVFMRAKLVICGEESFFRNISTENPLKMPLSPVFMRCAVKFNFSFITVIYYNGFFL